MANEEGERRNNGRNCASTQTENARRQRPRPQRRRREPVTVRRAGTRYPTQSELLRIQEKTMYGITGRQMFLRFLCSFILVVVIGLGLLVFGLSFISQARRHQMESHSSIAVVFCVLSIVLGILMHLGALVLAHYIFSRKLWREMDPGRRQGQTGTCSNADPAIPRGDSCASLGPPDPENAPPLYSICQQHALAPSSLQYVTNSSLHMPDGSPVSPELLFVLPSYEDIVNEKEPSSDKNSLPPAYCKEKPPCDQSSDQTNVQTPSEDINESIGSCTYH